YDLDSQGRLRLLYGMRLHGSLRLALTGWRAALRSAAAVLTAALLVGCASLSDLFSTRTGELMLHGYDPVAYYTIGRPMKGSDEFKVEHQGVTYSFVNDANRRMFITAPERYLPAFGGLSANAMVYSLPVESDPQVFKIIDGKLHVF